MIRKTLATLTVLCSGVAAFAAGFDGLALATNDWFDASFTSLAVDTVIATNTATGITRGEGSWTAAPTNGTATVVSDADAGGGATLLSLDAPDETLLFAPAALTSPTDYETVSFEVKSDAFSTKPMPEGDVQGAFTLYDDGSSVSAIGYVAGGWTNLEYSAGADTLTNVWFTAYLDFATVDNVRYVRYSVKPAEGSLAVLEDSEGTTWFPAATNATTIAALGLSGCGSCRGFSGDSLAEVVATYNGVGYGSVADAIAAAAEDGTVTLVKAVTGENIAVTENVTLALGTYNLTASSFTIASGKTLAVTGTGTISTPAITGGGSLAFSNAATLNLTGGTSALAAITAESDLTVTGNGTVNVAGDVEVDGTLAFTPDAATSEIIAAHPYYTVKIAAATVTANALNGAATIETTGGVTASAGTFYGTFGGTGGVTATGSFAMQGPSSFAGGLTVSAGTLSLSAYNFNSLVSYNFDASNASTWEFDETNTADIKKMKTTIGAQWNFRSDGSEYACLTNDAALFGGKTVMWIPAGAKYRYDTDSSSTLKGKRAFTILTVYQKPTLADSGYLHYYNYQNSSTWDGVRLNDSTWSAHNYTDSINDYVYVDGVHDRTAAADKKSVLSVLSPYATNNNRNDNFGGDGSDGFKGAVAEVIGLNTQASIEQSAAITTYLMHKWDLTDKANYAYLPDTTSVAIAYGAVIDLGGHSQTIAALSGSGIVSNGTLSVTAPISVAAGDMLVIPYGSTYTCASGTGAMVDETAGTVTLKHCAAEIVVTDPETSAVTTTIYDTVAEAVAAYTEGTLTIHDTATLDMGTTEVNISGVVLDDGVELTLTQHAPWSATFSEGTLVNTRTASTYVWTPGENSTDWATLSNWRIGESTPVALPGENDKVVFPASEVAEFEGWLVSLSGVQTVTNVIANADVTFAGARIDTLEVNGASGVVITLGDDAGFGTYRATGSTLTIAADIKSMGGGVAHKNQFYGHYTTKSGNPDQGGTRINFSGKLTGDGYLQIIGCRATDTMSGDWSEFSGTVELWDDRVSRHTVQLTSACVGSSNAVWIANISSQNPFAQGGLTTYFGALNGAVHQPKNNYNGTWEIGALNQDCAFSGQIGASSYNHIRKVGTATLTFTGSHLGNLEVKGGVFASGTQSAIPNGNITFSGEGGCFDPTTNTVDFAAKLVNSTAAPIGLLITNNVTIGEIPASNTRGLVKKGEGTLTLAAAPLYTGETYLDGGTLKIPTSANIKVKTHVNGKSVWEKLETIKETQYTVYTLDKKPGSMVILF